MRRAGTRRSAGRVAFIATAVFGISRASAGGVVPDPIALPATLSLDEALRIFRARGLDLLIAEAAIRAAEGGVRIAGAVPNPNLSTDLGNAFTYATNRASLENCKENGAVCSPWTYAVGISDSAALEDTLSGKRGLRLEVAKNALAAAKMSRTDAERTIAFQVKAAFLQVALASVNHRFAGEIARTQLLTLKKFRERYDKGAINEGDLERIEVQRFEAEQALDAARQLRRQAEVTLAVLLGARGAIPDFEVDTSVLAYAVPATLKGATEVDLLRLAFQHRPDLIGLGYLVQEAEAQIELTSRQRFPDITLGVTYAGGGFGGFSTNGPVGPQMLSFGLSFPLPVFYNLDGELTQARAQYDTNALLRAKTTSQVASDVSTALAAFVASRRLVERMEGARREDGGLLQSAKGAFEIVAVQYEKGAASLTDYLDALRTYIATKTEYFGDQASYWTAVYQLEAAVGTDLR
jgi:cobalt-zinc-cadmium efflux system outer membrane protein